MKKSYFTLVEKIIGLLVFLISAGVFVYSAQPTVAFWDCGEYAACSAILGIPHPPGNPLFIVLGRFILILFSPFISSPAYILNLFSAVSAGVAIMVLYFISLKALKLFFIKEDSDDLAILFAVLGSFAGALFTAFSTTWWFNSVESEVYSTSMLIMLLQTFLALKWYEERDDISSRRYLYTIVYLAVLGTGIHMYTMMTLPAIFLFYLVVEKEARKDWLFLVTSFIIGYLIVSPKEYIFASALLLVILPFVVFERKIIALIVAFLASFLFIFGKIPIKAEYFTSFSMILMLLLALFIIIRSLSIRKEQRNRIEFIFTFIFLAAVGYSVQGFIPLRAMAQPAINENDPQTWDSFLACLERKQYGDESMFKKMFHRQGSLINQFGTHPRMGFAGFFIKEYGEYYLEIPLGKKPLKMNIMFLIPGLLGFLGLFAFYNKEKNVWLLISTLFFLSSVGLILYMNFSDGTRGVRLEVRDRDYFFTPAFMYFGNLIALGIYVFLTDVRKKLSRAVVLFGLVPILVILPFTTLLANYPKITRRGNFIPYDYAYNLLNSCEENGILFTNGDNDTFPLWYLQEAEGVRKDVIVANLSLLNTDWYIKQLKKRGLPTSFSDEEINKISPIAGSEKPLKVKLPNAGLTLTVPARPYYRVQDRMVLNIVDANKWVKPIYFAITVGNDNFMGLDPYMQTEAMVYRVVPKKPNPKINFERAKKLLFETYVYRGLDTNSNVYLLEEDRKLLTNYAAMFIMLAQDYLRLFFNVNDQIRVINKNLGDSSIVANYTKAKIDSLEHVRDSLQNLKDYYKKEIKHIFEVAKAKIGRSSMIYEYEADFLNAIGEVEALKVKLEKEIKKSPSGDAYAKYLSLIIDEYEQSTPKDIELQKKIEKTIDEALKKFPDHQMVLLIAADFYERIQNNVKAKEIYEKLLATTTNPGQKELIKAKINQLAKILESGKNDSTNKKDNK